MRALEKPEDTRLINGAPRRSSTARKAKRRDPIFRPLTAPIVPRLLKRCEAAAYWNVSPSQFDLLRARGEIVPVRVPSDRAPGGVMSVPLFDRADLDAAIERWKRADAA
jgi:hypothetical protein